MGDSLLENVCFKDVNWLQAFGIDSNNALDYFSISPFYDKTCNNEVLKMQTKFNNDLEEVSTRLSQMIGTEYGVLFASPPNIFVIAKKTRSSPTEAQIIATYLIYEGNIYLSPNLNSIMSNRIISGLHHLERAMIEFKEYESLLKLKEERQKNSSSTTTTATDPFSFPFTK